MLTFSAVVGESEKSFVIRIDDEKVIEVTGSVIKMTHRNGSYLEIREDSLEIHSVVPVRIDASGQPIEIIGDVIITGSLDVKQ